MRLPEICIRQPVLAIVLSLVIAVLGLIGFKNLEIRFFPKLQLPVVNIYTYYQGASASLMESQVTTKIENAVAGIDNVQYISSSSGTSSSSITVQFRLGGDIETEAAQVRDQVAGLKKDLPADANPPSISVGSSGGNVVGMSFVDDKKSLQDARDYLIRNVSPVFTQLAGVAGVGVYGSTDYAMRVWLNSEQMAARGVTVADIKTAITANNIYFPAGAFRGLNRNYGIVSDTRLKNAQDFENIVIKKVGKNVIRMKDVAKIELGMQGFYDLPMHIGTKKGLAIQVSPLGSANPITVANEVVKAFQEIKKKLPPGMHAAILYNNAGFLQASINETFYAIGEAVVLVILVVILFLGSLRAASIPIVTIPISLVGVFFVINMLGFSINIMSLLAMVLAIGLVVDDAIVMLENIHRHIEEGETPVRAAVIGSREIAAPIIVMALTLVAVYAPVGFVQGVSSELFKEFAFTLASAVVISAFVALTLSPMMCSRVLLAEESEGKMMLMVENFFSGLSNSYHAILEAVLRHRVVIIVMLVAVACVGSAIYKALPSEFLPKEDYGRVEIGILAPGGSTLQYTEKYATKIMKILHKQPDIQQTMFQMSGGYVGISCYLKPWGGRKHTSQQVAEELNPILQKIPGVDAIAVVPDIVSYGQGGRGVTLYFTTTQDYSDLLPSVNKMLDILRSYPGVQSPDTGLKFDSQQYSIKINRDLAAELGVSIQDIADTIQAMMSGIHWTDVQSGSRSYAVELQMKKEDLMSFDSLQRIYVPGVDVAGNTHMVPLSSLITVTPQVGQSSLQHFNRLRAGSVSASVAPGYTESQVIAYINSQLPKVLVPNVGYAYAGKAAQYLTSSGSMAGILTLSFAFIYLVLAAQFGSFIDPFIILFAVPLSMVGALFSLWLSGGTISLYSQIGIVTLVGLISKHGILITKFINDLRMQGMELHQAIVTGAKIRFRPVLMTTLAMIFGTLPLVIASGPGSVGRHQIGWTIIGGLVFGTFFSLIVVPVAYSFLGKLKKFNNIDDQIADL